MTKFRLLISIILLVMMVISTGNCQNLTDFLWVSNFERTRFNEVIWFWRMDTLWGPVHSNDYLAIKYDPYFYGQVSTSKDRYLEFDAAPYFEYEPIFNAPLVEFPTIEMISAPLIGIPNRNGELMTWIQLRGDRGAYIYQYPRGTARAESLYSYIRSIDELGIFVNGDLEIEGELSGSLTIYAKGDIKLLDNVIYTGADPRTGMFEEGEMRHRLALVAGGDIIIADTYANGRANGWDGDVENSDRHSIAINAALIALRGGLTIEHQNDDWDLYQGPEPDERGMVFLKGSIAQYRRGYIQRSNHRTTGYDKTLHYDNRFKTNPPPYLTDAKIVSGRHDWLYLGIHRDEYVIRNAIIENLTVAPGVELILEGSQPLVVKNQLKILGEVDNPVIIRSGGQAQLTSFVVTGAKDSYADIRYANFLSGVETRFQCDSLRVSNSEFNASADWEGTIIVDSCSFAEEASFVSWTAMMVSRNLFEAGLKISGRTTDGVIINNSFIGSRRAGLEIRGFKNLRIVNNIVANNRAGIDNQHWQQPELRYNNVFGSRYDDYVDCEAGIGSISADPLFVNQRQGDYNLEANSPCINTGDPSSPLDPDGTRADIGAFAYFTPPETKWESDPATITAYALGEAYPNPFNSETKIRFDLPVQVRVSIKVYDLSGRIVVTLVDGEMPQGRQSAVWTASGETAGVYLLRMEAGGFVATRKVVLVR